MMLNVISEVAKRLDLEQDKVEIRGVTKNNGSKMTAVVLNIGDMSPVIYIDDLIDGLPFGEIDEEYVVSEIVKRAKESMKKMPVHTPDEIVTKDFVLEHAFLKVINKAMNQEVLTDAPHRMIADLAVTVRIKMFSSDDCYGSALVDNSLMRIAGVNEQELFKAAYMNTKNEAGFRFVPMATMLAAVSGNAEEDYDSDIKMIVGTSVEQINGATILAYTDMFRKLSEELGSDLYILPSSIHEVIVLDKNAVNENGSLDELKEMVVQVNSTVVNSDDILSNNVYEYDYDSNEIRVAA